MSRIRICLLIAIFAAVAFPAAAATNQRNSNHNIIKGSIGLN